MTAPVVQATATGGVNSSTSPHSVNLPSGIVAGELLVCVWSRICFASVTSVTTPSGWTQASWSPLVQGWGGSGETIRVYYKTATGSEGSTISMAFDDNGGMSAWSGYRTYRIAGANLAGPALITATLSGEAGGYYPDPPNNSPGSTKDWLWLAVAYNYSALFTAGPSGYSNLGYVEGGYCKSAFAEKTSSGVSSEDPGAFALADWGKWGAATIAIGPYELTGVGAIASAEAFGTVQLIYNRELVGVGGIASAEAFGLAQVLAIKGATLPAISAFTGTHAWSVAAWAKWTSRTSGRVFSVWDSGGNELAAIVVDNTGSSAKRAAHTVSGAANDGYYHLYAMTYDGVTLRFYIDGRAAGADVASSTSLAAAAGMRAGSGYQGANPFGGSLDDLAVFDYYLSASQVAGLYVSGTTSGVDLVHDSSGSSMVLAGWQPHAYMAGYAAVDTYSTALALAANGGSIAIPIQIEGKMALRQVSLWNTDAATARSWNWSLYYQPRQDSISNVLFRVAAGVAADAFTPGAASKRSIAAAGAPTLLGPGSYWLVIQNTHATSTFGLGSIASGPLSLNRAQTKTLTVPVGDTLDFTLATWTKVTAIYAVILEGDVLGLWGAY